eukprot:4829625-Amphidinium_carterae.1
MITCMAKQNSAVGTSRLLYGRLPRALRNNEEGLDESHELLASSQTPRVASSPSPAHGGRGNVVRTPLVEGSTDAIPLRARLPKVDHFETESSTTSALRKPDRHSTLP